MASTGPGRIVAPVWNSLILALLVSGPGCTAIGYGLGLTVDESRRIETSPGDLTDADLQRPIDVTTHGRVVSGRLRALLPDEDGRGGGLCIHVVRKSRESSFYSYPASSDTIPLASVEALRPGGEPGAGATVGGVCGMAADVLVLQALINGLREYGEALQ